ncbi:MAG: SCO family protein [Polyangiales bacterium]
MSATVLSLLAPAPALAETQRERDTLQKVAIREHLGRRLPLDVVVRDHQGRRRPLANYFDGKRPVLLTFAYYRCPVLCPMVLQATAKVAGELGDLGATGPRLLTVSIDPKDTSEGAADKRRATLASAGDKAALSDWAFLTTDAASIRRLTKSAGFGYAYDANLGQYAHSAVLFVLGADGRLHRYLYGLNFPAQDVRLALSEVSDSKRGAVDQLLLYCFRYDPNSGRYVVLATRVMQVGGTVTAAVLAGVLGLLWRRERLRRRNAAGGDSAIPHDEIAGIESAAQVGAKG